MKFIIVLSGIPASGKSTWGKNWCKSNNVTLLSFDESFPEWHKPGKYLPELQYKEARREFVQLVKNQVKQGKNVVVDDNCIFKSMRHEFYQIAQQECVGYVHLHFNVDLKVALGRNGQRLESERIPEDIIQKMYEKMEPPTDVWSMTTWTDETILEMAKKSHQHVLHQRLGREREEKDRQITTENHKHQLNLALNRWIHEHLAILDPNQISTKALQLSKAKKEFLQHANNGNIEELVQKFVKSVANDSEHCETRFEA